MSGGAEFPIGVIVTTNAAEAAAQLDALSTSADATAASSAGVVDATAAQSAAMTTNAAATDAATASADANAQSLGAVDAASATATTSTDALTSSVTANDAALASRGAAADTTATSLGGTTAATAAHSSAVEKDSKFVKDAALGYIVAAGAVIYLGMKQQEVQTSIANSANISDAAASKIVADMNGMAFSTKYSTDQMGTAFAGVAGQLKTLNGGVLSTSDSMHFVNSSNALATASGQSLQTTYADVSQTLQEFGLSVKDSATATTTLYNVSRMTGMSVDDVSTTIQGMRTQFGSMAGTLPQISGMMLDFAQHGETGSRGMRSMATGMAYYLKVAAGVPTAQNNLKMATDALTPSLVAQLNAMDPTMISKYESLVPTATANAIKQFETAKAALQKAQTTVPSGAINANGSLKTFGELIGYLSPKMHELGSQQARIALLSEYVGTSANKMYSTFMAGAPAYDKALKQASDQKTLQEAAARAQQDLSYQIDEFLKGMESVGGVIGKDFLPEISGMVHELNNAAKFFEHNKAAAEILGGSLLALGAVITGVFAVNKIHDWSKELGGALKNAKSDISGINNLLHGRGWSSGNGSSSSSPASTVAGDQQQAASDTLTGAAGTMESAANIIMSAAEKMSLGGEGMGNAASQEENAVANEEGAISREEGAVTNMGSNVAREEGAITNMGSNVTKEEGAVSNLNLGANEVEAGGLASKAASAGMLAAVGYMGYQVGSMIGHALFDSYDKNRQAAALAATNAQSAQYTNTLTKGGAYDAQNAAAIGVLMRQANTGYTGGLGSSIGFGAGLEKQGTVNQQGFQSLNENQAFTDRASNTLSSNSGLSSSQRSADAQAIGQAIATYAQTNHLSGSQLAKDAGAVNQNVTIHITSSQSPADIAEAVAEELRRQARVNGGTGGGIR